MKPIPPRRSPLVSAAKIAMTYASISVIYILFSDKLVTLYFSDLQTVTRVSILKGWGFVFATSLLILILLKREFEKYSGAEKELIESQHRSAFLADMLEKSFQPFVVSYPDGRIGELNSAFTKLTGFSKEELARMDWTKDLTPPEWHEQQRKILDRLHQTGVPQRFEKIYRRKDGSEVPVEILTHLKRNEQGQPEYYYSFVQDITDRKHINRQLEEEANRRRILFEESPDGILIIDPETTGFVEFNAAAHNQLGYSRDEFKNLTIFDIEAEETPEETRARIAEIMLQGRAEFETRQLTKAGEIRDVHVKASIFHIQGEPVYHCIWRDITEEKRAEKEIRDSEERSRRLIEASTDAILARAKDAITYANPAAVRLFKAESEKDLIGKMYLDLVHPDDREESIRRIKKNTEERKPTPPREHRMLTFDGQVVQVESTGIPVFFQGESQTFGIFRDITERKQIALERDKLDAQVRQAQKMEAIGTLAGGIAHDFNNILSVIMGNAEILAMSEDTPLTFKSGIDQILTASQRAKQLVSQILTFSRQGEQRKLLISLKPVIKETVEFLRASLPSTIQLIQHVGPNVGAVIADPTQMQQILMNLSTNAAHSMEERGGVLKIELNDVVLTEEVSNALQGLDAGSYMKLTVSDTGHGMSPEVLERIFDPYFTTKAPGKGTGLGLSVVHGIIKSHGGAIKVFSEVGKGTIFDLFLPRAGDIEHTESKAVDYLPRGTEKILLVDDEVGLVDIGKRMLSFLGYSVEGRTSPIEALELFRENPDRFHAIVTDMTMPQMTGVHLAREIKAIRPGLPIILCTGFSEQASEVRILSAGIQALLFKPIIMADLAKEVRKVLDQQEVKHRPLQ